MSDATYNGWTNRATWAVALHVNNDQGWQENVHEIVREHIERYEDTNEDLAWHVAEAIKDDTTSFVDPLAYVDTFGDVPLSQWVNGAGGMAARDIGDLDEVNWHELAESFIADVKES